MAGLDAKRTRSNAGTLAGAMTRLKALMLSNVGSSESFLSLCSGEDPVRHQPLSD